MAQALPRSSFTSSRLVRVLAEMAVAEVGEGRPSVAERLGQWLDFTDSIALSGALAGGGNLRGAPPGAGVETLRADFARVRNFLAESIVNDGVLNPGPARVKLPTPALDAAAENAADFDPYHRYVLAHQRDMGSSIAPLRAHARAALAGRSPSLKQLADLDAVLEQALGTRERNLLATIPLLLSKRFAHLHAAHVAALGGGEDDVQRWLQPGGWLTAFAQDLRAVLLAELELRMAPVAGLIEALGNEEVTL
ncbi:MAG: DUF3348 domain-containing protein [Azonexus sp.]|jgi:hypothetical protein|nr:DUF3348 domain-containing protein [Betaproteobacteria bacterium]MBK8919658.1 DUF3348 domain-containing protein [Betaproteobacteria bacterium]MBP6034900.1 DUF3348 domain-containing protein [Azonexus sp.]MBP6905606.1 DUF3348 domain-containing protein [Azonexus sp.]